MTPDQPQEPSIRTHSDKSAEGNEGERRFLHEISNPMSTVFLMLDGLLETMSSRPDCRPDELTMLKTALQAADIATDLIKKRKTEIATETT